MDTKMDALGRIVVPKVLRDRFGLSAGDSFDVSWVGDGIRLVPGGRTARLVELPDGSLAADSETAVTDEIVFDAIDAVRR